MRQRRQAPDPVELPEPAADPAFDLRQGLIALVAFITFMVVLTLICVTLAR